MDERRAAMKVRTQLKVGVGGGDGGYSKLATNHNETLAVRTTIHAGKARR
jgi:hypothetical protein